MSRPHFARAIFVFLMVTSTGLAVFVFRDVLAAWGMAAPEWVLLGLYGTLVAWIGASFWICIFGAAALLWDERLTGVSVFVHPFDQGREASPRIAVIMPLHNEDAGRAFSGLQATYESLADLDAIRSFHFFVLSDSGDPVACRNEEAAWVRLCRDLEAGGRVFYRRRRDNAGKKAGNIKEFCERWGRCYEYMVVLDADSVMAGRTILEMVRRMDQEPQLGLLQAWPVPINGATLFARVQQFAAAAYGRLIAAGLSRLMEPHATYWGHNAIVRTDAFMQSCGLPRLPGREPLGGEILSHDFVEAALLLRRGWRVRIMRDGQGSYEEAPPNLLDHTKRDRRWCQGNLQHARLLYADGLKAASRFNFMLGIFSYGASLLWLSFMVVAVIAAANPIPFGTETLRAWLMTLQGMEAPGGTPWLIALTAILLLGPKLLGLSLIVLDGARRHAFGGTLKLAGGGLVELLFTAMIAPVMMLLHAEFVVSILAGRSVKWTPQRRDGEAVAWVDAARTLGPRCAVGIALAAFACWWAPALVWWMAPLLAGFTLAVPVAVWSSCERAGERLRRFGILLTPSETMPHPTVSRLRELRTRTAGSPEESADPLVAEARLLIQGQDPEQRKIAAWWPPSTISSRDPAHEAVTWQSPRRHIGHRN